MAASAGARSVYTRFAGMLAGSAVAAFDAAAFRLTPGEAALMDPHARLLLEHVAEAAADARCRLPPVKTVGSSAGGVGGSGPTGVYVGCMWATGESRQGWKGAAGRDGQGVHTAMPDEVVCAF